MQLSDPRQQRIYKRLALIGPGPAAFYKDACALLENHEGLFSKSHLVAHLLREIESSIRSVIQPLNDRIDSSTSNGKHKASIKTTLQTLEIPEDTPIAQAWLQIAGRDNPYGLSARAHRRALSPPRLVDREFRAFFDKFDSILDSVLDSFESHYLESHRRIDELLAIDTPTKSHVRTLSNNIPNNLVALSYFFDSLDDDSWLELLDEAGYFQTPPEPDIDHEEERVLFPQWPQTRYLARVASNLPELAHKIAIAIPDSDNISIQENLTEVALALDPSLAKDFVPKAIQWLSSPYRSFLPEKLGDLVAHLLNGKELNEAFALAESLFAVRRPTSVVSDSEVYLLSLDLETNFFEARHYQRSLNKLISVLVDADPEQAINLLCRLLDEAVALSAPSSNTDKAHDTSHIWRPAIEEQGETHGHPLLNALTSALVSATEQVLDYNKMQIESVVNLIDKYRPRVFERLIFHILQRSSYEARIMASERIVKNINYLDELGIHREYALLLLYCCNNNLITFLKRIN